MDRCSLKFIADYLMFRVGENKSFISKINELVCVRRTNTGAVVLRKRLGWSNSIPKSDGKELKILNSRKAQIKREF